MLDINKLGIIEREARRRKFSQRTIETYKFCLEKFLNYINKPTNEITKKDIREFLESQEQQGKSGNTLNVYYHALRFYFQSMLGRKLNLNISLGRGGRK